MKVAAELAPWSALPVDSGRLTRKHRTSADAGGQVAVAGLGALGGAAQRGAVEGRRGEDRRAGEGRAATAGVLGLDGQLEGGAERVRGRDRHRVAKVAGAVVRDRSAPASTVSPGIIALTAVRTAGFELMSIVPVVNAQVDAARVGELGERDRAGADREHRDGAEQGDDPAAALAAPLESGDP